MRATAIAVYARLPAILALAAALACGATACRRATPVPVAETAPRVEEIKSGPVSLTFIADPPRVRLDRDVLLTIRTTAPSNVTVKLPVIDTRLQGFTGAGAFDREPRIRDGQVIRERCIRLTPQAANEYRIAPMAIVWHDGTSGAAEQWFPTRALVLPSDPLVPAGDKPAVAGIRGPVWIAPDARALTGYAALVLVVLALLYGLWRLLGRAREAVRLRRLSPRERALHELAALMAANLVVKGRVKEFYFELTMIVRRYIERAHAVRAPEQTTEEFLAAVSRDPRFGAAVVARLREFLQAADLVKYAAHQPDRAAVDGALDNARDYVETDAAAQAQTAATGEGA